MDSASADHGHLCEQAKRVRSLVETMGHGEARNILLAFTAHIERWLRDAEANGADGDDAGEPSAAPSSAARTRLDVPHARAPVREMT